MQESPIKDLCKELKNKHAETNTVTEIKYTQKELIPEYSKVKNKSVS